MGFRARGYNKVDQGAPSRVASEYVPLNASVQTRIHERIVGDLPNFERQLATSVSVQERLHSLSRNVDTLSESISDPEVSLAAYWHLGRAERVEVRSNPEASLYAREPCCTCAADRGRARAT